MRPPTLSAIFSAALVLAAACNVGDGPAGSTVPDDPVEEEEGLICQATLAVRGALTPSEPAPSNDGCVPFGTWTVNVTLEDAAGCDTVPFQASYVYEVTALPDEGGYEYSFPADPSNENIQMKITEGGPGDCEATFQHYSADGKELVLLKPHERDLVLSGQGQFERWSESQIF